MPRPPGVLAKTVSKELDKGSGAQQACLRLCPSPLLVLLLDNDYLET